MSEDWRINLERFAGPLDLLLHLVRKEEVDIHDIPISSILEQYLGYLALMTELDLEEAGDFMVMASTLMLVKSRMLLPSEDVDLAEEIDPRYELVQQLLEYKRLKDSTQALEARAESFARTVSRPASARPEPVRIEDKSFEEVGLFDMLAAFQKILDALGPEANRNERRVRIDDKPVRAYAADLHERLRNEGTLLFSQIVGGKASRQETIGWFLALLLLLKKELISVAQGEDESELRVGYREAAAGSIDLEQEDDFR